MSFEYMYPPGLPRPDPGSPQDIEVKKNENLMFGPGLGHDSVSESSVINKSTEVASERFTNPSSSSASKLSEKQMEQIVNGPGRIENAYNIREGIFRNNVLDGPGKILYKNREGAFEQGIYRDGQLNGFGQRFNGETRQNRDVKFEEGRFEEGELHGFGKQIYYNGTEFEGVFEHGRPADD